MSNTRKKVKRLLEVVPFLKDNDQSLCTHIWFRELEKKGIDPFNLPTTDFLKMYAAKKLTLAPSIKRARAKLQEEYPELRGKKYTIRKGVAQQEWRKKLGYDSH
tara:strand:- start:2433 stop:2744 length:312 start_codon:yes stop_codon:yes gene_type:complete